YLATLKSRNSAVLQSQVEGDIVKIFVRSGQRVEAGAPIFWIDPRQQEANVDNMEAAHKTQQTTIEQKCIHPERTKKLFAPGGIAKSELDAAQSAHDVSKADVEAMEASIREQKVQLRYYTVNSPTAGTVGDIPVRVGDHVTSQTLLTTLDHGGPLEAYVYVPSEKSSDVRMGMPVDIMDDAGKPLVRTRISFISPRGGTESQHPFGKYQVA